MSGLVLGLVVSVLMTVFVVVMVLAFERRRARGTERDLPTPSTRASGTTPGRDRRGA